MKPYSKPFNRNIMKQKKIRRQPQKKPSPRQQKPRKREDGRPQGTLKRFPFDETRIGFMLRYEMPVVYHLLRRLCATQQPFEPDWQVIRSVAENGEPHDASGHRQKAQTINGKDCLKTE